MPVEEEGKKKGFSSSIRQYIKKLRCAKLNVRLATVHKKSTQEDVLMKNLDIRSIADRDRENFAGTV